MKRAHTETFIPVTNDDYNSKKKYKNVTELNMDRGSQKMNIPSMEDSRNYLKNQRKTQDKIANEDAYELLLRCEKQEKLNQLFLRDLRLLK